MVLKRLKIWSELSGFKESDSMLYSKMLTGANNVPYKNTSSLTVKSVRQLSESLQVFTYESIVVRKGCKFLKALLIGNFENVN